MGKYKRYYVTKATFTIYEAYDRTQAEALEMVKNNTSGGLAGLPTQRGFNTLMFSFPLVDFKVSKELSAPKKPNKQGEL